MKKICPTCKREYRSIENFCTKCGIELVKEQNKCSKMRTKLCRTMTFAPNDMYCSICGAPTTYLEEEIEGRKRW